MIKYIITHNKSIYVGVFFILDLRPLVYSVGRQAEMRLGYQTSFSIDWYASNTGSSFLFAEASHCLPTASHYGNECFI